MMGVILLAMVIAYIGLGSNLGDREAHLRAALEILLKSDLVNLLAVTPFVETAPMGGPSQPYYLNAVARIRTELPPPKLLEFLKEVEHEAGRTHLPHGDPQVALNACESGRRPGEQLLGCIDRGSCRLLRHRPLRSG